MRAVIQRKFWGPLDFHHHCIAELERNLNFQLDINKRRLVVEEQERTRRFS